MNNSVSEEGGLAAIPHHGHRRKEEGGIEDFGQLFSLLLRASLSSKGSNEILATHTLKQVCLSGEFFT